MAEAVSPPPRIDSAIEGLDPAIALKIRRGVIAFAAVLLVGGSYAAWRYVSTGKSTDRWEELSRIERGYGDEGGRAWLEAATSPTDVASRDDHIRQLEDFLAKNASDAALAAHVHARIANLEMTQVLALSAAGGAESIVPRIEAATKHLETLRDKYPDAPINWKNFAPGDAASVTRAAIERLAGMREWVEKHGLKPVEPDPDVVAVLRTTEGDLRLRFYASASPKLVAAFVDRVCSGALEGTSFFLRRDDFDEGWIRGGDERTKKTDATDADRASWGEPSPGDTLLPEEGRNRVLHVKGVVSAWHEPGEVADDPTQFIVVTKPSPHLDYDYTPFARVDGEASMAALERIFGRRTRVQEKPEMRLDPKQTILSDQFSSPVVVKRALVYEKGALKACIDATKVADDEKRLDTLKGDALRELPPAPPAAPAPAPAAPSMADAPMDGAGK